MSPIVGLHATSRRCRDSIREYGIIPSEPTLLQPFGVYVFSDDDEFTHPTYSRSSMPSFVTWAAEWCQDVWAVAYIGPIVPDHLVANALVFLTEEPVTLITLITGHNGHLI